MLARVATTNSAKSNNPRTRLPRINRIVTADRFGRAAVFCALLTAASAVAQSEAETAALAHGEYVFRISGCGHCHTAEGGAPLAGGRALETSFGTFYSPNITADENAGIGAWSFADFERALRHGNAPDGSDYYPAFPYTSYTRMIEDDLRAMFDYIRSLPASPEPNREHDLAWYLQWRFAATAWKWMFFDAVEFRPDSARSPESNRGAYIAEALAHCGECHTPRGALGALQQDLAYAGNAHGPDDDLVPNITPHATGIGDWGRDDLKLFLQFGELPDGEYTAGSMDPVIEGLRHLSEADRDALIEFLLALPPIDNKVSKD